MWSQGFSITQKYGELLYIKQQTSDLHHPLATDHSWRPFVGLQEERGEGEGQEGEEGERKTKKKG